METNPLQRYNKYFDYASKIVHRKCTFSTFIVCMMTKTTNALPNESALVVLIHQTWQMGLSSLINARCEIYASSSTAACAAAKRAIGTRNGEQEA